MQLRKFWVFAAGAVLLGVAGGSVMLLRGPRQVDDRGPDRRANVVSDPAVEEFAQTGASKNGRNSAAAEAPTTSGPVTRQGQLAATLASRLGLGDDLLEPRAIALLTATGIAPSAGWSQNVPASQNTIGEVQRSVHELLAGVATELSVPPPPTLNLFIFDRAQSGGQVYHVGPRDMNALRPNGGAVAPDALKSAASAQVLIASPSPCPIGDDLLPTVWSQRLRHRGASFVRIHFDEFALGAPSYVQVLDKYGLEIWRRIGGEQARDLWAAPVPGDTVIIALHAGAVASGSGILIDRYEFGPPPVSAR